MPQREIEQQLEKVRIEKESAITQQMYERAAELRDAERKLQEQLDGERQSQRSGSSSKLTVSEEDVAEELLPGQIFHCVSLPKVI